MHKAEQVNFWRLPQLSNLELLHATYVNHCFAKHIHDCFAIGVIEHGALKFSYRGEKLIAPAGCINLVVPGEAHDGSAGSDEGWTYRMFYLEPQLLEQAAYELVGSPKQKPFFMAGTIHDDDLANQIRNLHFLLEQSTCSLIEQESRLLMLLTTFIARHADQSFTFRHVGKENRAVNLVREYIEDTYTENISIKSLAQHCHLSPFHLIRVFRTHIGVPPHVYLKQVRIKQAKLLLAKRMSIASVAHETGFVDQSHFSRQFKQITGITPNQYSNIIQENSSERATMK
ncbi:AraC family transcriptional regulator [Sporomusaceae bacterium FL31]|nr:AraC family transcriptional regulator [Sporomusaceae bacterium FL31]GCE33648.1 AraC family transcriptional regulator [Sporomusaceae bacterium]